MKDFRDNRVMFALLSFFFFLIILPAAGDTAPLAVLVYHQIEDPTRSDVSCTPRQFNEQLEFLLRQGCTPLSLDQVRQFLVGGLQVNRPILITFDDGYESLHAHALPAAQRLRVPMTVFVVTSRIGLQPQFTRYLSRSHITSMAESGWFQFGSHTHDMHFDSTRLFGAFRSDPNPFLQNLFEDLNISRQTLEQLSGKPIIALAWPYGKHNRAMTQMARHCGYFLHFTSRSGLNEPGTNPFGIKRIPVTARDTPQSVFKKAIGKPEQ
jgi:peptidoglycan/xylan/chitin deacetylase (PgdA/CDA1 family)